MKYGDRERLLTVWKNEMKKPLQNLSPRIQNVAVALGLFCSVYEAWHFVGLYKWASELQVRLFGLYEARLTWVISLIGWFLAFCFLALLFAKKKPVSPVDLGESEIVAIDPLSKLFFRYQTAIGFLVVGLVFMGISFYQASIYLYSQEVKSIELSDLEQGKRELHPFENVALKGKPLTPQKVSLKENHVTFNYIPVVSREWKEGDSIALVLEVDQKAMRGLKNDEQVVNGIISPFGIPSNVRSYFGDVISLRESTALLKYKVSPDDAKTQSMVLGGLAVMSLMVALLLFYKKRRSFVSN